MTKDAPLNSFFIMLVVIRTTLPKFSYKQNMCTIETQI